MVARPKISLDKEKFAKLFKDVFEKEFKKEELTIKNIISSNFTLTVKKIKSLKQEVTDLQKSMEFMQSDLKQNVADVGKDGGDGVA